jgi:hypothetical protein
MQEAKFPIEYVGGSRDGEMIESRIAPDNIIFPAGDGVNEIYARQNNEPPFVYVQIGYVGNETWK